MEEEVSQKGSVYFSWQETGMQVIWPELHDTKTNMDSMVTRALSAPSVLYSGVSFRLWRHGQTYSAVVSGGIWDVEYFIVHKVTSDGFSPLDSDHVDLPSHYILPNT